MRNASATSGDAFRLVSMYDVVYIDAVGSETQLADSI